MAKYNPSHGKGVTLYDMPPHGIEKLIVADVRGVVTPGTVVWVVCCCLAFRPDQLPKKKGLSGL